MEQAWLDSLSEDWVSQPRSAGSPVPTLPSLSNSSISSNVKPHPSRIPIYNAQKHGQIMEHSESQGPLSERSESDKNIPPSQRAARRRSKLREEVSQVTRGRTMSVSTTQSVQHNTIQHHKSISLSPKKISRETPEWKRRLLHGDVAYGEQCDLFSPAGLENMFRPPTPVKSSPAKSQRTAANTFIMPSSPPPFSLEVPLDEQYSEQTSPRKMKYKLVDESHVDQSSSVDQSRANNVGQLVPTTKSGSEAQYNPNTQSRDHSSLLHPAALKDEAGRVVSGQSDFRNEELSPIYIARHSTIDGRIDYAALDISATELHERLESLQAEKNESGPQDTDDISLSLGDRTANTDEYAHDGHFINLQRGGRSHEGSFQRRLLSPSSFPANDDSALLPEESMQASTPKQLPNVRKMRASNDLASRRCASRSPSPPRAPHPSPSKSTEKSSCGSPLKLFGTYDTFTNQKLLRRLSQFEGTLESSEQGSENSAIQREFSQSLISELEELPRPYRENKQTRKMNSFGEGDLDDFQFSEEVSYNSSDSNLQGGQDPSFPVPRPSLKSKPTVHLDPPSTSKDGKHTLQHTKYTSTINSTKVTVSVRTSIRPGTGSMEESSKPLETPEDLATRHKRDGTSGGKRLPKSPLKDSTPKRRRTLQDEDGSPILKESSILDFEARSNNELQSVIGRKRKDAKHGDDQQAANANVLASRQILRPRNPTPSQRSSLQSEYLPSLHNMRSASQDGDLSQSEKIARVQRELDSHLPRNAAILGISQAMRDESRKGSVTTQDFLDEAKKIMAGIRDKVRAPRSGLTSLEESESEGVSHLNDSRGGFMEDSYQESTQEPFSRPPSREGAPVPRQAVKQQDPTIVDHLRKYEEKSEVDGIASSSIKSNALAEPATGAHLPILEGLESDPPNIRIIEPDSRRKRKHSSSSTSANVDEQVGGFSTHASDSSSGKSTSRSIPTGSSRGSDSRRVIVPESVSHLIPEQVAGMFFDRARNTWIKRKEIALEAVNGNQSHSDETEDPFNDIPDLSVDETQENQRLMTASAGRQEEDASLLQSNRITEDSPVKVADEANWSRFQDSLLEDAVAAGTTSPSSENITRLSWDDKDRPHHSDSSLLMSEERKPDVQTSSTKSPLREVVEEVEREISLHEGRDEATPRKQRRNVTISFSSPLASIILSSPYKDDGENEKEKGEIDNSEGGQYDESSYGSISVAKRNGRRTSTSARRHISRSRSRRHSLGGHQFLVRPVSRIDEQEEESTCENSPDRRRRSLSLVLATPTPSLRASSMVLASQATSHEEGIMKLTPLSNFTARHSEESFAMEVSYMSKSQRRESKNGEKRTLSLSIKELVGRLAEVEPYEPFWEHIKQIQLRDKKLSSLHKLDEFCDELVELDVCNNQISQLNGVPSSIRHLRIVDNYLSDLTSWSHLHNLQYIDVSGNDIESLAAFKGLVHLRGLRADNNKIKTLDGIGHLDGLVSLRARGNVIETLDFQGTKLQHLSDLDLNSNKIRSFKNLHHLSSLTNLSLEDNLLETFAIDESEKVMRLKHLKLSSNNLKSVDVGGCPDLRLLYLDRNRLGTVTGLLKTKHLDSLSMREQKQGAKIDLSFLREAFEVRKLFLSGNFLGTFRPGAIFLNLQYLEMANCGLESLPAKFGLFIPNMRVLNLNFNALRDITPLMCIVRLKKLHLAGNRLCKLAQTASVLRAFRTLTMIDMRNNPLTLGFYPSVAERQLVVHDAEQAKVSEPFTLAITSRETDEKYESRLDMITRMLRRSYEILIFGGCPRLRFLDGLDVDRSIIGKKDEVWQSMVTNGIVEGGVSAAQPVEPGVVEARAAGSTAEKANTSKKIVFTEEERWQAEDSFA